MLEKLVERTNFVDVLIIIISSLALVAFWRGAWGLLDLYLLPADPALSFWVSIGIGIAILLAIAWYKRGKVKKVEKEIGL